jgi:hypothetical protein
VKRIVSIAFLFVFLFNIAGYYAVFLIQQQQIRSEVRNNYRDYSSNLNLVCIAIEDGESKSLRWFKEDEFLYKGEFYDVVRVENDRKGEIRYWCIHDSKEKSLLSHFEKEVNKNTEQNNTDQPKGKRLAKSSIKDYLLSKNELPEINEAIEISLFIESFSLSSSVVDVITPPPQLC